MCAEVVEVAGFDRVAATARTLHLDHAQATRDDSPGRRRVRYLPTWAGGFVELNVRWSRAGAADRDPVSGGAARGQTRGPRGDSLLFRVFRVRKYP